MIFCISSKFYGTKAPEWIKIQLKLPKNYPNKDQTVGFFDENCLKAKFQKIETLFSKGPIENNKKQVPKYPSLSPVIFAESGFCVRWPCQIHLRSPPWGDSPSLTFLRKPGHQGFVKSSLTLQIAGMSSSDLRARMDGLEGLSKADAVYPEPLSRHNRSPIVAQQVGRPSKRLKR